MKKLIIAAVLSAGMLGVQAAPLAGKPQQPQTTTQQGGAKKDGKKEHHAQPGGHVKAKAKSHEMKEGAKPAGTKPAPKPTEKK